MGFLRRLFGGESDDTPSGQSADDDLDLTAATEATFDANSERQRVTVWLRVHDASFENEREQLRVFALENLVMAAVDAAGVGEHDTNSLEPGYFAMRLYGNDASAITETITPLLDDVPAGSYLAVRHGPVGAAEDRVELGNAG
jgi:hypothetical protein